MQTEPDRQKSHDGDDCDQDDQRHCPGIDTEQHVQTSHHLTDAQAERGGDTKDRAKDSQQIDRVTDRSEDSIAKNRMEQGPKRQWQFLKKEQIRRICGGLRSKKLKISSRGSENTLFLLRRSFTSLDDFTSVIYQAFRRIRVGNFIAWNSLR